MGLITGAADDDCSAIGTYAAAGAKLGPSFLWTAPATLPMMCAVVYLSAKLGRVSGRGLFQVIHDCYPRWLLYSLLVAVLIGNTIEAGADIGGMAAAVDVLMPGVPFRLVVVGIGSSVLALQIWASYTFIRNLFRWMALSLLAYVGAAIFAKPALLPIIEGTLMPHLRFDKESLSLLVAIIGTTLSAYIYTWQSNEEVEEEIALGRKNPSQRRKQLTDAELRRTRRDVVVGMIFANVIMYFIMLSTASTLYSAGHHDISSAADAARALEPIAGKGAELLFAIGIVGVGFLAVPVMTAGAAYDVAQAAGWRYGLGAKPREAKGFYAIIGAVTVLAMGVSFLGLNPMKMLVWSGIVQGFSTPPLLLLILLMTNRRDIMGEQVNGRAVNILGGLTTVTIFAATVGLVVSWFM